MKRCFQSLLGMVCVLLGSLSVHADELKVISVTSTRTDTHWLYKVLCDKPVEPLVVQCLIDVDANLKSGREGGYDLLVEGDLLYQFNGPDPAGWTWEQIGGITRAFNGNAVTYTVPISHLTSKSLRMQVRLLKSDYSTVLGQMDDVSIQIDDLQRVDQANRVIVPLAPVKANRDLSARKRVQQAKSFYCYYGSCRVGELSAYDMVILHSPQMDVKDIAKLKKQGVVTIGYITVGEDDKLSEGNGNGPDGKASWFFDRDNDGKPDQNGIWKSYYANAMDPLWRENRVKEAVRLVTEEGYDGIFLDTIDTAVLYPETAPGMIQLVRDFRKALPEAPIVLNQGYTLLSQLAPMSDAFMLESFTATYDFQSKQYMLNYPSSMDWHAHKVRQYIEPVLKKNPLTVLVLDYAKPDDFKNIQAAADRAATFGFLFASAPIFLDDVYINDIVGKPDPRWLQKQATPQSMSFTLPEAVNGFPIGTVVMPSTCYGGYTVKPVVDGIANRAALHWSESAWASAEVQGEDVWLAFEFKKPQQGGRLKITWATDQGKAQVSQRYQVQIKVNGVWQDVVDAAGQQINVSMHPLPDTPYSGIRIHQPAGGGPTSRPNLMWIAQVQRIAH